MDQSGETILRLRSENAELRAVQAGLLETCRIMTDKAKETNLQNDDLKETEAELRGEITKYRQANADINRLNQGVREALKSILDSCESVGEDISYIWVAQVCASALAIHQQSEKRNHDAPPPLAGATQCGTWTEWGQCVAEKPCKVHG